MNIDKLLITYEKRSAILISELKKDPIEDIRFRIEMNLVASNLVQEYLLLFYSTVSRALESICELELNNKKHIEGLFAKSKFDELEIKFNNPNKISDKELSNISLNLQKLKDEANGIQTKILSNEKYLKSILSCFSESINSAIKIYDSNKAGEAKNAIMVSIKFIISSLFPFLSGIDSIHQIIKSRSIKFSNANSYFREMNEYWNSCFAHAVTTKYLAELLNQYLLKGAIYIPIFVPRWSVIPLVSSDTGR